MHQWRKIYKNDRYFPQEIMHLIKPIEPIKTIEPINTFAVDFVIFLILPQKTSDFQNCLEILRIYHFVF